ncbi:MAG: hypothetical protein K8H88_13620 [Sandaracinaceae bacterium]|nr:hypothetical protein [Sandaracinaceae bacterium]
MVLVTGARVPDEDLKAAIDGFLENRRETPGLAIAVLTVDREAEHPEAFGFQPRREKSGALGRFTLTLDRFAFLVLLGERLLRASSVPVATAAELWSEALGPGSAARVRTFVRDYIAPPEDRDRRTSNPWDSGVFRIHGWPTMNAISFACPLAFILPETSDITKSSKKNVLLRDGVRVREVIAGWSVRRSSARPAETRDQYHARAIRIPSRKTLTGPDSAKEAIIEAMTDVRAAYVARHARGAAGITPAFAFAKKAVACIIGKDPGTSRAIDEVKERSMLVDAVVERGLSPSIHDAERAVLLHVGIELAMQERYAARFEPSYQLMEKLAALYRDWYECKGEFALAARNRWAYVFVATAAFVGRSDELHRHLAGYPVEHFLTDDEKLLEYFTYRNIDRKIEAKIELYFMLAYHHAGLGEQERVEKWLREAETLRTAEPDKVSLPYAEVIEMTRAQLLTGEARMTALREIDERKRRFGLYYADCHMDARLLAACHAAPDACFREVVQSLS